MYYLPNLNGNMPAVQERLPLFHGVTPLALQMQIGTMDQILIGLSKWANFQQIHGAFLICMEMSGNGRQTGID